MVPAAVHVEMDMNMTFARFAKAPGGLTYSNLKHPKNNGTIPLNRLIRIYSLYTV